MDILFSPYSSGGLELRNRIVMAPMTRSRAIQNNAPGELEATYYKQRSGAGLIITEGTAPSPNGLGYPRIPGIYSKEQIAGWRKVTDAVHKEGGKIFLQIMHVGRVGHTANLPQEGQIVSPSSKSVSGDMYTDSEGPQPHTHPKLMDNQDINQAIQEFVQAAKNAIEAGFDGVELHGANGYLIEQFLHKNVNELENEYGGSVENRVRFLDEVAQQVVAAIGPEKVGLRLSPYGVFNDTGAFDTLEETFALAARKMKERGITYIHIVDHSAMGAPEVPDQIKEVIRKEFGGTIILSGGYDASRAEKDLKAGKGELVAFGRPFISNPDLVQRFKAAAELADPDQSTFYTPGSKGYIDYPNMHQEKAGV
jgi:N-ethylmaleimide reductase